MIAPRLNKLYIGARRIITKAKPITIVTYHSVSSTRDYYSVSLDAFTRQMQFISSHYSVARLRDITDVFSNAHTLGRTVIVTFDDGYCDFIDAAYPVLKALSIPCTVFVPTGFVGGHNEWDSHLTNYVRRPIMSPHQLIDLKKDELADFGSHSVNHMSMTSLSVGEMRREVLESKGSLEDILNCSMTMFSYPYGRFSHTTTRVLLDAKYKSAVTSKWSTLNRAKEVLSLKRIALREKDRDEDIQAKIEGEHDIYYTRGLGAKLRAYRAYESVDE